MLGYEDGELEIDENTWMTLIHPDDFEAAIKLFGEHWEGRTPVAMSMHRIAHKDGHWMWVLATAKITERDEQNRPLHACGIVRDFSRCKDLEAELKNALEGAQAAVKTKGAFLANMSHEIRTPMVGILGAGTLLMEAPLNTEQRDLARMMVQSTKLLLSTVNNILDLSKIEEGCLKVESIPVNLGEVMVAVEELFHHRARHKGIQLEVANACPPRCWVLSDPTRLRQILYNLVGNAIKFTNNGKVSVVASLEPPSAASDASTQDTPAGPDPQTSGDANAAADLPSNPTSPRATVLAPEAQRPPPWRLYLRVADTGIGMSPDMVAHVFDRFRQADASITRLYGGSGLGTTISKTLAALMGGDVVVASEEGKGSTFTVALPDNNLNRRILEKIFSSLGIKTIPAANGLAVMDRVADSPQHHLIFMDIEMPVCNGITATRQLREKGYRRPIVALTANVMETDRQSYIAAGMDGALPKPITKALICAEIDELLSSGMLVNPPKVFGVVEDAREACSSQPKAATHVPPTLDSSPNAKRCCLQDSKLISSLCTEHSPHRRGLTAQAVKDIAAKPAPAGLAGDAPPITTWADMLKQHTTSTTSAVAAQLQRQTLDLREEAELAKRSLNVIVKNFERWRKVRIPRSFCVRLREKSLVAWARLNGEIELAAHRLPRARGKAGPPPLLLTFKTPADKISFLRRRKRLEKTLFTLDDDLTLAQQQWRRELWPTYLQLRQTKAGQPVYWKGAAIYTSAISPGRRPPPPPAAPATPDAPA
eukprot:jgi/Mesvir1/26312/Mv22495-RA.1